MTIQKVQQSNIFVGFSSIGKIAQNCKLYDIELVKQDLLNQFNTIPGERVMNPRYGSIIWQLLYEPFTDGVSQMIVDDTIRIINSEPRVQLQTMNVNQTDHGITIQLDLLFLPFNIVDTMIATFEQELSNAENN